MGTNYQHILEEAIKKSIAGGWRGNLLGITIRTQHNGIVRLENLDTGEEWSVEEIIYNKRFAEALWGKYPWHEMEVDGGIENPSLDNWQYHLQQMIIADDPIKYLGSNI